nr:dipeptide ABC transporter ATP-binding protein [Micromonospora sp. DSM 115978]
MSEYVLETRDLVKHFPLTRGILFKKQIGAVRAVDGISLQLRRGETLGVVGESGCGKSTLAKLLVGLEKPTSGSIVVRGQDIARSSGAEMRRSRRNIQLVMQDPYTSLNPRMTVGDIVGEPFDVHPDVAPPGERRRRVQELIELVGLNPDHINRYPHQFSGGQRQRIGIARALALKPEIILCDEPVSALDVSIQAQVVNLLEQLQDELGLSYIFIAHDLSVVRHIADRVAVMYLGKVVEIGTEDEIYERPTHPYTQALLSAVPVPDPTLRGLRDQIVLEGDVPSPADPPSGCRFRTRCWKAQDICAAQEPALVVRDNSGHPSACHFAEVRDVVHAVE